MLQYFNVVHVALLGALGSVAIILWEQMGGWDVALTIENKSDAKGVVSVAEKEEMVAS